MKNSRSMVLTLFLVAAFLFTCLQVSPAQVVKPTQRVLKSPVMKHALPDIAVELKSPRSLAVPMTAGKMNPGLTPGSLIGKQVQVVVKNIGNRDTGKFFVDVVLSTDTKVPVKMATYSPIFQEDVLILGGRLSVINLAPGKSQTLSLPAQSKIPDKIKTGIYYLAAVADPGQTVKEKDERNNVALMRIKVNPLPPPTPPVTISSVGQTGYWSSGGGFFEIHLGGSGFGSQCGNKTVRIGSYEAGASDMELWSDTQVIVPLPNNFPFGNRHDIAVWENGSVVSNVKQNVLIYMDITAGEFSNSDGEPIFEAPAGATIRMRGLFGANQGSCVVKFGGVNAQIVSWTYHTITFVLPNLSPGQYPVFVEKNGERVSFQVNFTISTP